MEDNFGKSSKIMVDESLELEAEMVKLVDTSKRVKVNIGTFFGDKYWDVYFLPSVHFTHWDEMTTQMGNRIPSENKISFRFLLFFIELTIINHSTK